MLDADFWMLDVGLLMFDEIFGKKKASGNSNKS